MKDCEINHFGYGISRNINNKTSKQTYGIVTKNNIPIDTLNPKICPNCNEGNTQDAKFCSKCKMIMSYEGYQEALESQSKKEDELQEMKKRFSSMEGMLEKLVAGLSSSCLYWYLLIFSSTAHICLKTGFKNLMKIIVNAAQPHSQDNCLFIFQ